jgi:hypothetical protein
MPHSIFFHKGYAIHGTTEVARLGKVASHGCVRLHPVNAAALYTLVERQGINHTRIVVSHAALSTPVSLARRPDAKPGLADEKPPPQPLRVPAPTPQIDHSKSLIW